MKDDDAKYDTFQPPSETNKTVGIQGLVYGFATLAGSILLIVIALSTGRNPLTGFLLFAIALVSIVAILLTRRRRKRSRM